MIPQSADGRLRSSPSAATLVLWRHGVTAWNVDARFQGCNADNGLTEQGFQQARTAAPIVAALGPTAIFCSPLMRARQTCAAVEPLLGLAAVTDDRLREIDVGDWCGRTSNEILASDPAYAHAIDHRLDYRMGVTGETRMELAARVGQAFQALAEDGECRLIVSHGWALQMGVAHVLGCTYAQSLALRVMGNCAVSVISRKGGLWRIERWNIG